MDWAQIITGILSAVSAIGVAIISKNQKRDEKRRMQRQEKIDIIEANREKRDMLQIDLIATTVDLSLISAKKLTNRETNGDVEEAMATAKEAQVAYKKFCERVAQNI